MLWYQRGYLPLHASALLVDGRAVAVGRARIAASPCWRLRFRSAAAQLIADDMMVVDCSGEKPMVLPGYQKLRLWKDACEELGLMGEAIAKALPNKDKFVLATVASPADTPVPLTSFSFCPGSVGTVLTPSHWDPFRDCGSSGC